MRRGPLGREHPVLPFPPSDSKGDHVLVVRPGTTPALGFANGILRDRLYDAEYVKRWTDLPPPVRTDTLMMPRAADVRDARAPLRQPAGHDALRHRHGPNQFFSNDNKDRDSFLLAALTGNVGKVGGYVGSYAGNYRVALVNGAPQYINARTAVSPRALELICDAACAGRRSERCRVARCRSGRSNWLVSHGMLSDDEDVTCETHGASPFDGA